jgi:hypothetical protein
MPRRSAATAAKTLFLLRHAKSSWKEVVLRDGVAYVNFP